MFENHGCEKQGWVLAILMVLLPLMAVPVSAHKVNVFAWVEEDTVHTQSKFSGGKKVKGGKIIVYDAKGNRLLEGKTNDRGEFSFKAPKMTAMKIVLEAGMGHKGEWMIPEEEIRGMASDQGQTVELRKNVTDEAEKTALPVSTSGLTVDDIRLAVEKALDQKLTPVIKMLAESQQRDNISLTDVVGGIGYILGLLGLGTYVHYRKKNGTPKT
jgi:nickel transport protein